MEDRKKEAFTLPLQIELEAVSRRGITLWLGNMRSTPEEIINAHIVADDSGYMRDYIQDEKGKTKEIRFDKIKEE